VQSVSSVVKNLCRLLAICSALGLSAGVAFAHPSLIRSDPPANATLPEAPRQVTVWFDEAIEPDYGHLEVFDVQGRRVDNFNTEYHPGPQPALTLSLPALPEGTYIVVWRVISRGDAHAVGGAFAFGVGLPPDPSAAADAQVVNTDLDFTAHLIRYLSLFAQAIVIGAIVFHSLIWQPVMGSIETDALSVVRTSQRRYLTVLSDILRAALVIGALGALYIQSRVAGVYFWELLPTRWGVIWIVRAAAVFLVAGMLESLLEGRQSVWIGLGLGAVLLGTTVLTSHSAAKPGIIGPLADGVHLLTTAIWGGGLLMLALALLSLRTSSVEAQLRRRLSAELLARFSGLASACVGLIVASGLLLSQGQVRTWSGLLLTPYGRTLLVKLIVVAGAFSFGVYNSLVTRRRVMASTDSRAALWVGVEAALVAGVIFFAAILTNLAPATAQNPTADTALALSAQSGGLQISGQIRPARLGSNAFELRLTDAAGLAVRSAQVELFFQPVGGGALSSRLNLTGSVSGLYTATGTNFTREGPWQILVTVQRPGVGTVVYANFDLNIGPDGVVRLADEPLPGPVRVVDWLNRYGRVALVGLILVVIAGWGWVVRQSLPALRQASIWWLTSGLWLAALTWFLITLRF
jgi:copper transport protein